MGHGGTARHAGGSLCGGSPAMQARALLHARHSMRELVQGCPPAQCTWLLSSALSRSSAAFSPRSCPHCWNSWCGRKPPLGAGGGGAGEALLPCPASGRCPPPPLLLQLARSAATSWCSSSVAVGCSCRASQAAALLAAACSPAASDACLSCCLSCVTTCCSAGAVGAAPGGCCCNREWLRTSRVTANNSAASASAFCALLLLPRLALRSSGTVGAALNGLTGGRACRSRCCGMAWMLGPHSGVTAREWPLL